MKTKLIGLLAIVILALWLVACDSGSSSQISTTPTPANVAPGTLGAQRTRPAGTPGASRGGTSAAGTNVPGAQSTPAASTSGPESNAPTALPFPVIVIPTPYQADSSNGRTTPPAPSQAIATTTHAATVQPAPAAVTLADLKGKIIFFSDRDGGYAQLYVMNADGSNQHLCNCSDLLESIVADEITSPDGHQFLFVQTVGGGRNADTQIWRHNNTNNTNEPVTGGAPGFPGVDYDPAWSPDSRHIAWVSETNGKDEIHLYDSIENSNVRLTESNGEWYKHPSFSPDGSKIAYWTNVQSALIKQIWVMNLDGGGKMNLSNNAYNDYDPMWVK